MAIFLDRIDAVPVDNLDVPFEYKQWVTNLVDTLNHSLEVIGNNIGGGGGGITWQVITGATSASVNNGYIANGVSQIGISLPATCAVGDIVRVIGLGAGGWQITGAPGQSIAIIDITGTQVTSDSQYDCIELICAAANTTWVAASLMTAGVNLT